MEIWMKRDTVFNLECFSELTNAGITLPQLPRFPLGNFLFKAIKGTDKLYLSLFVM